VLVSLLQCIHVVPSRTSAEGGLVLVSDVPAGIIGTSKSNTMSIISC
jgi:hypothetical protein